MHRLLKLVLFIAIVAIPGTAGAQGKGPAKGNVPPGQAKKVLFLMLYYSGFLVAVSVITGTLGSVQSSGTTALIMRVCVIMSFLLFTISLGRRKQARA